MKRLFFLAVMLLVLVLGFWKWYVGDEELLVVKMTETKAELRKRKDAEISLIIDQLTQNSQGRYAVMIQRLGSDGSYGFNSQEILPARSAIKVPIILTAIRIGLEEKYEKLLLQMGLNSDNQAQASLEKILGKTEILRTLEIIGMTDTDLEENTTTADDLVKMWKYVYQDWQKYEKYFTDSIYEDRITKGLPEKTKLIHKVGTDVEVWNDSGIVIPECAADGGQCAKPFILVILNDGVNREEAVVVVPAITKMVWDYENSW